MVWGTFTIPHIVSLLFVFLLTVIMYLVLRRFSDKVKTWVLFFFSLTGISAIIYELIVPGSPFEYLPLHMCSINAMLLPITVLSKNKVLGNLILSWCLGALIALVMNQVAAPTKVFSRYFFVYYGSHTFEFIVPVLLFTLGLIKFDFKYIISTILITIAIYTAIHLINLGLNEYFVANNILGPNGNVIQVNYMFSLDPSNPALAIMYSIIPYDYWYMYLAFPIIVVYLLLIGFINKIFISIKARKTNS